MIRVAICESARDQASRLRSIINAYSNATGISNVETIPLKSLNEFEALVEGTRQDYLDIVILMLAVAGDEVATIASMLDAKSPNSRLIVISPDSSVALCAYEVGADFLMVPFDQEGFSRTIGESLRKAFVRKRRSFAVKSQKGVVNMNLNDITFVEANKKGPIIHLPEERVVPTRGTLQALQERLSTLDERFVRAGGSFIINLDNVRSIGESSVVFGTGETIILPVRARKPIRDAVSSLHGKN